MTVKEKAERLIINDEYLLALEILYKETNDISKGPKKLLEVKGEFEKMKRYTEDFVLMRINMWKFPDFIAAFNSLSETSCFKDELSRAFSAEDLTVFDTLNLEKLNYFQQNITKLQKPVAVASCYENGRIFVFFCSLENIEIAILDLRLREDLRLKIVLSSYEDSLNYFETNLEKYYRRKMNIEPKLDKVTEKIEHLCLLSMIAKHVTD